MKSSKEFADYLDVLTAKAPGLRAAGVFSFKFEGEVIGEVNLNPNAGDLLPPLPPKNPDDKQNENNDEGDPLDDPTAYGLGPGETLPWQEGDK